ncbi:M23 family peptidase [Helicobacter mustelae]|uniref:M23 family metallopeptidase n=1 Tax=Helicobacter mustelae TaxID=217 RepID=UPI000E01917B|nr:M23 family metallopeptidase [Helicobacter mustelae]STP12886.1 M23 family peptidase [Helicobacter mustelae]
MQNKLVITIVDERGSRQFQVHKHIKKIIFFGVLGLLASLIGAFFFLRFLMKSIENVAMEQNIAISEYLYIYQQNENLKDQIQKKTNELDVIHQKIGDLETIIDTQKNNQKPHHQFDDIDLENLSPSQKQMILNLVPNGDPIIEYEDRQRAFSPEGKRAKKQKQPLGISYTLALKTPIYATSDGVVESIRTGYKKGFGNYVRLNHSFGFSSLYAHLENVVLKRGQFVKKGTLIGYALMSTKEQNPALYYEVSFVGKALDSELYTQWSEKNFNEVLLQDKNIDWKSLVWVIKDILRLQDHQNHHGEKSL